MEFTLTSPEDTEKFGKAAAQALLAQKAKGRLLRTVYLSGELGAGKTTFTRAFVGGLPNAENAEVASPSFTICHEYPTDPEIYHADLYRLPDGADLPEELTDLGKNTVLLIEWAERLSPEVRDKNRLDICITKENCVLGEKNSFENIDNFVNLCQLKRHVKISAHGETALEFENELQKNLQNCGLLQINGKNGRL